jgi:hypothetical protein
MRLSTLVTAFCLVGTSFTCDAFAHLHPTLGRFLQRDPQAYIDGTNLIELNQSNPAGHLDPSGENNIINGSSEPVWVWTGGRWVEVPPGGSIIGGDNDMVCPPASHSVWDPSDNDFHCLKLNDCHDGIVGNAAGGGVSLTPQWPPGGAGYGNNAIRRCCCRDEDCRKLNQNTRPVDPVHRVAPMWPPGYFPP